MSQKAWTLPKTLQETCGSGQRGGHSIQVLNERRLGMVEICVLCGW